MAESLFFILPEDIVLNIFFKLEDDPLHWARMACVCTKFFSILHQMCWKTKCSKIMPGVVSDLLSASSSDGEFPGGWSSLYKLGVCCPGLHHSGVLLENSDFGLEREIGPDEQYLKPDHVRAVPDIAPAACSSNNDDQSESNVPSGSEYWSLFDDLYYDTFYDPSESGEINNEKDTIEVEEEIIEEEDEDFSIGQKRKATRSLGSHLASGVWNLSREQGNKLLASRFRSDCLYISDWPGCTHVEEKRNYMLFRGFFKNFKRSRVWRTINDGNGNSRIDINCAYCACKETWDLHSAFCLRRVFGYHDDGDQVVRAYVCENGHVSGAWTDLPLYT